MSRVFVDRKGDARLKKSKKSGRARVRDPLDDALSTTDLVGPDDVCVILCSKNWQTEFWKQSKFFSVYANGIEIQQIRSFEDSSFRNEQRDVQDQGLATGQLVQGEAHTPLSGATCSICGPNQVLGVLQDFVESLPFARYSNPVSGMLNLTTALPEYRCRPDVGPKGYIATGRMEERDDGTDSVAKLHLDMTDAVNVLVHAQNKQKGDAKLAAFR